MTLTNRHLNRIPGTPAPDRVVETAAVTVALDEWGPSDGSTVVLLHGGGQTRHAWRGLGQRLGAKGYYTIAPDLRGHGDSSWAPDGDYSYDACLTDLVALLDALGKPQAAIVGASLGGGVALTAAGEHRVAATAIVIVDTAPRLEASGVAELRSFMTARPDGFDTLDEVAASIASYTGNERTGSTTGLRKNLRIDDAGRYHWHWDPAFMSGQRTTDPTERERRLERCARALTAPTLLVRGARSNMLSEASAQSFLALCPHSEYANIDGASHMVAGDRNDRFGAAVEDFLDRRLNPTLTSPSAGKGDNDPT